MKWKNRKLIWSFKFYALLDVLFSKRFELNTFTNGCLRTSTKFDYDEIKNAKLK